MYRQILIHPDDRRFQRILWRNNSGESIKIFELKTVTYGMSSAPYAAIKCLQLLAEEAAQIFPKAAETIRDDFYVDDVLSGSQTLEETLLLRDQIRTILSNGCFNLAKWASNDPHILMENQNQTSLVKFDHKNDESKTLGLLWDTKRDCFQYSIQKILSGKVTKRKILSIFSKIYDPLGLLGPVTLTAKILIQDLWALKLGWDESIPISTHSAWTAWAKDLENLNQIEIPRHIFQTSGILELHCFCDASNKAYGGAIYVRSVLSDGTKHIHLLCAKSRVVPLKTTQLPRLELCGALLVSQLCDTVLKTVKVPIKNKYFWTDSKITLAWISSQSSSLKTFVANRVSEIQNLTHIDEWKYVPTGSNPADLISRGLTPNRLINNSFWFNGPAFLAYPEQLWPVQEPVTISEIPERKKTTCLISNINNDWDYLTRFSNFTKLTRSVSYLNRFIANTFKNKNNLNYGPLTILELDQSVIIILKHIQKTEFFAEIKLLSKNSSIQSNSKLLCLNPFLDNNGILRVGGRLDYAPNISDLHKHPYLLPKRHYVTKLIIRHFHQTHIHAGPQATLAALRQKFWILTGRSVVRQELRKCVRCFRTKPNPINQLMGNLPRCRIEPSRPFSKTGLDYCGPININLNRGREKPKMSKSYVAVFVCMATKAVHLELVLDCTTDSFMQALKRFTGRRGKPSDIYSDNGKTFVGAANKMQKFLTSQTFETHIKNFLVNEHTNFHFISPSAPHMGGLWEAAVKSAKRYLKRVIGITLFTFEEMQTLLIQVEACLNSRPLTPLSTDPNDLTPLTPGHFLVGTPLTAIPEPMLNAIPTNRLSRWQHVTRTQQHFWKRWSTEYLTQLQQRHKWTKVNPNSVQVNDLVVIKEDNTPPLAWRLGRITDIHPGNDGLTRVVSIKTAYGVIKRPLVKVCILPMDN